MAKFKIGDKARVINAPAQRELLGKECIIVSLTPNDGSQYVIEFIDGTSSWDYGNYYEFTAFDENLEPIIELGSWKEIEESIGWNPMREVEHEI